MISFEDFSKICSKTYPRKSLRWIEIAYREYNDGILTDKTPLSIALLKLVPYLSDDDCVKDNFLKIKASLLLGREDSNGQHKHGNSKSKSLIKKINSNKN